METDRLRYFCLIAESGSLTKAAEILNISHSGLSKAMTVLQEELGTPLFRPQGRGLEVTEAGKLLYKKSKDILQLVENIKDQDIFPRKSFLRIGLAETFSLSIIGLLSLELHHSVDFYDTDSGEAEVKILQGVLDFALSFVPFPHKELEYLKIKKTEMGVFYTNPEFERRDIEELPFIVPNIEIKNNPLSLKSKDGWPAEVKRNIAFGSNTLSMAIEIVTAGSGAVFIPKFLAKQLNLRNATHAQLREYQLKKTDFRSATRDIYLVKKKNVEESKEMKMVSKVVRKIC